MAIKALGDTGFVVTGADDIALYRLHALRGAVMLEMRGMRRSGKPAWKVAKQEFAIEGGKREVYEWLTAEISRRAAARNGA